MPSFESHILAAPCGFTKATNLVNALIETNDSEAKTLICKAFVGNSLPQEEYSSNLKHEQIYKCLSFIFKGFKNSSPAVEVPKFAQVLDNYSSLNRRSIEFIVSCITNPIQEPQSSAITQTQSKRLRNLQWKIGIALASSTCKSLMTPYVAISFDVYDLNGNQESHSMEMSYSEFKEFRKEFQKMSSTMDKL